MRRLYDWVIRLAGHPRAILAMGVVSFAESSFFPIPPDVMLVPMILANRRKAFTIALVCTVCSVLGGLLGYAIGFYFFETIGAWVVKTYGLQAGLEKFRDEFARYGTWVILIKGLTPIPYKLVTIASGAAHFDLFTFVWASIVTRGIRFFFVAALLWKFGEPIRAFIEKRLMLVMWLFLIVLVGGFVAVKFLFA
jgi:membrane protein YqaA with SNARE-associated domain